MTEYILLTGGTGFLGTEIAARLVRLPEVKAAVLVRAGSYEEACHRLREAWQHDKELYREIGKRFLPVPGDFTQPRLGLAPEAESRLLEEVTLVIHAGAQISFRKSREELMRTNAGGTKQMLFLASRMKALRRFVYISTAYVAGRNSGIILEEDPPASAFSGFYEESKAAAEKLVRESGLPFSVCRPGMIVGDSETGWIRSFNTVYYVLKLLLLEKLRVLPVRPEMPLNLVPGDCAAEAVVKICLSEEAAGKTFHLTCPEDMAPRAGELAEFVRVWAKENLDIKLPSPVFIPAPVFRKAGLAYNKKRRPAERIP